MKINSISSLTGQLLRVTVLAGLPISSVWADGLVCNNLDSHGVAIQGYDPVGFFVDHQPEKGDPLFHVTYQGATYYFITAAHAKIFSENPAKYVPQFGGYCAYGVSRGKLAPISPNAYQIIDGKLYLQYDTDIRDDFNQDQKGNLTKAWNNWPKVEAANQK